MPKIRFLIRLFLLCVAVIAGIFLALAVTVWLHFDGTLNHSLRSGSGQALLLQDSGGQGDGGRGVVCGLVFGAAVHGSSQPGPGIARRVETAARLYREGILQHIIMTGGKGSDGVRSEAAVMRDFGIAEGIDPDAIVLEDQARSTWENLVYSRPLTASCSTVIGISDRYHLARIEYLASLQGFRGLQTFPSDISATTAFEMKSLGREVAALLYYISLSPFL